MALTAKQKKLITNLNPATAKEKLGDQIAGIGVAVPDVAAAPTQADFNGLLASLRKAGVIPS